jgi:excisionase family DNA binding protein
MKNTNIIKFAPKPLSGDALLEVYWSLPRDQRGIRFRPTAHAAQLVGLSQRTIQHWIATDRIQAIRMGKNYLVDLDSLKRHLAAHAYDHLKNPET